MAQTPVPRTWSIGALLQWTADFFTRKGIDEARLSAELLLAHTLGCSRMQLYTQYDRVPAESQLAGFREMVKQRAEHVPVAYLIGKAWFFSFELNVTRDVLIPRPDTETLVENVIQRIRNTPGWETPGILDLCTGSGCIAIALAKNIAASHVVATDISPAALKVATGNAEKVGVKDRVEFFEGDLYGALAALTPPRHFEVIISNPPYIATGDIPKLAPNVRDHEPKLALDGGADGLDFHRRILSGTRDWLKPGGMIIAEIAYDQGESAGNLYKQQPWLENIRLIRDAAGNARAITGNLVNGS